MSIRTFDFAYGRGRKTFELDDELILKEVRTETFPVMENVAEGVLAAIHHPIGLPSIAEIVKPGDTVAFICNDPTRVANSFDFMPVLVNEMNRLGGTHREMSHEEMVEQVGEEVASRLRMFNSIATKSEDFEYFGDTSRGTPVWIHKELCNVDHVILTGTIVHHYFSGYGGGRKVHHYFSGYGGGRKAVLPGCAAMETVRVNHSFMLDEKAGLGITKGNPCYEDQMEGVALFGSRSLRRAARSSSSTPFSTPSTSSFACSRATTSPPTTKPAASSTRSTAAKSRTKPISSSPPAAATRRTSTSIRCKRRWTTRPAPSRRAAS